MFSKFVISSLFIAAGVVARPALVARDDGTIPSLSEWSQNNLESWWRWHVRYNSLGCDALQGTDTFNTCCLPLAANQTTADLPAECTPTTLTCASAASVTTTSSSAAPAPTDDSSDNQPTTTTTEDTDYDESNLPICEDPNDDGYDYDDDGDDDNSDPTTTSYSDNSYTPPADSSPAPSQDSSTDYTDTSYDTSNNNSSGNTDTSTNNNSGSNNNGGNVNGNAYATYFYQGGNAGACGNYHSDYDLIGAIDIAWYGDTGSASQYCGRSVTVQNLNNQKTVTIIVADVCPTCNTANSFDLSVGAFQAIADLSEGLVPIQWWFN